jgi:hypothetical protein
MGLQRCWALEAALLAPLLAVGACSAQGEGEELVGEAVHAFTGVGEGRLVAPRVAPGSELARAGLPRGKWRYQGRIPHAKPGDTAVGELLLSADSSKQGQLQRGEGARVEDEPMAIMEPNGDVYTVELTKEERALITAALEKRGLAAACEKELQT